MEEASLALDPDGAHHRERLAVILGDLACEQDGAPYVARALVTSTYVLPLDLPPAPRLSALGDQLESARKRMKDGRDKPGTCKGVAGFTDADWRRLDAIEPE